MNTTDEQELSRLHVRLDYLDETSVAKSICRMCSQMWPCLSTRLLYSLKASEIKEKAVRDYCDKLLGHYVSKFIGADILEILG